MKLRDRLADFWDPPEFRLARIERMANALPAEQLEIAAQLIAPHTANRTTWPEWDARKAEDIGARRLALIFRCMSLLAYTIGTAPIRVYDEAKNNETIPDHPMRTLMRRPNAQMDEASFWSHVGLRAATYGFCVVEKERDRIGNVIGLWPLRSAWLKAKPRRDSSHDWEYRIPGLDPVTLVSEDVLVFRWADTSIGSAYGTGPLEACFREVALINVLMDFVKGHVENGAVPVYGIIPELQVGNQSVKQRTQPEIDALIDAFVARHGGLAKANRPVYLQAIKEIVKIGGNLEEMAFQSLRDVNELGICTAFGVPPRKVGVRAGLEHSTQNATAQVEDAEFYKGTIIPLWTRFDGALTLGLLPEFLTPAEMARGTISLEFDRSDIDALQEDRNAKAVWVNSAVSTGWMSVKTAHAELGIPFVGKKDYYLRSFTVEAVPVESPFGAPDDGTDEQQGALDRVRPPLALSATTQGRGPARRLAAATNGRKLIRKVADAREPSIRAFFRAQGERLLPKVTEGLAAALSEPIAWTPELEALAADLYRDSGRMTWGNPEQYRTTLAMADINWKAEEKALEKVIRQLYELAGDTAFDAINNELGVAIDFSLANPNLKDVRNALADRVKGINEESRNSIRDLVTRAGEEGKTIEEITAELRSLFDGWTKSRAEMVALSESATSVNLATIAGYIESDVVDRAQLYDNPDCDTNPLPPTNTTCADRDGLVVPIEKAGDYVASMHPRCILATAAILKGESVDE